MSPTRRSLVRAGLGLAVTGALAGCSGGDGDDESGTDTSETTAPPTTTAGPAVVANAEASLSVERIAFAADRPTGYREFEPLEADGIDPSRSSLYVYVEPTGLPVIETDGGGRGVRAEIRLRVLDPEGSAISDDTLDGDYDVPEGEDPTQIWYGVPWSTPDSPPEGTYTAEVTITDQVRGRRDTATARFAFGDGGGGDTGSEYLAEFRRQAREEYDIDLQSATVTEGRLVVEYRSTYETESREFGTEVGALAGLYSAFAEQGWEVGPQVGFVDIEDGSRYRWRLDRETAIDFATGEISEDEWAQQILGTLTEV